MKISKPFLLAASILTLIPRLHAQWSGAGAGGAGTDFNTTGNWTGGTINGSFINNTSPATITLSADQNLGANGLTFFNGTTAIQPTGLTIDGTVGDPLEKLTLGGSVTLNRSATLAPAITATWASGASTITVTSAAGLAVGQLITGGSGLVTGTIITGISGNVISLSNNTTAAQASAAAMTVASGVILGSNLELSLGNAARTFSGGGSGTGGAITVNALVTSTDTSGGINVSSNVTLNLTNGGSTFTGPISGNGGTLTFTSIADFGAASSLGAGTAGTAISVNNYSLTFTGSVDQSSNRTFNIGNSFGSLVNNSPNNSKLTLSGAFANNINAGSIGLSGTSTGLSEISGVISNGTSIVTNVSKSGVGTWKLSGANTYTGTTSVSQGILEISSIRNVGSSDASSLGKVATVADGTINIGGSGGGVLRYVGTGDTSDRAFTIGSAGSSSSATLVANGSGALVLTGGVTSTNTAQNQQRSFVLDGTSTHANTFSGNIAFSFAPTTANANGANAIITKSGSGLWILGGASSYTFTPNVSGNPGILSTNVNGGTLRITNANAIAGGIGAAGGTGSLSINGGVLELGLGDFSRGLGTTVTTVNLQNGGFSAFGRDRAVNLGGAAASVTWGAGNFMTAGGAILQLSSAVSDSTVNFQNPIILGTIGTNTRTVQVNNGADAIDAKLSGNLTQSGGTQGLTKTGNGTLELSGANVYAGATTVSAGTLLVSGSISGSAITVQTGGTLGGSGNGTTTGVVGAVTVQSGGTLAPGSSPGQLSTGNLALQSGSTFSLELNGPTAATEYDQVKTTGTVALTGSTLSLSLGYAPAQGDVFYLILNDDIDAITGTFAGLAQGGSIFAGGYEFQINYFADSALGGLAGFNSIGGNDVALLAIPEPGSAVSLLGGLGLLLGLQRRRRRN